jgi:hypothetical protein
MKRISLLSALAAAVLSGCGTAEEKPADAATPPSDSAPVVTASVSMSDGACPKCNSEVFDSHLCGKTRPCRMCQREAGAQHRHNVIWTCGPCNREYSASHVCNDARKCPTCRPDGVRRMPPLPCTGCGGILTAVDSRPATAYCAECNLETGANHLHGKTRYCATCEREAGDNHVHNATKLCSECASEVAPDHQHGVTSFCRACGLDQGLNHHHGKTLWCVRCKGEKVEPHTVHTGP